MVKIRLHGLPEEVNRASQTIEEAFKVFSRSEMYADRGKSDYVRVYLDVEPRKTFYSKNEGKK